MAAALAAVGLAPAVVRAEAPGSPTPAETRSALRKAVGFFHREVARHGGYVWASSGDLALREGEARTGPDTIWVQPPGTPTVGEAMLEAHEATGEAVHLDAAREAAAALVRGQLHSGGWAYRIEFDPEVRTKWAYRVPPTQGKPDVRTDPGEPGGWAGWRRRRYKGNMTLLDDDTTQSALRFLMRLDKVTGFRDAAVHEAVAYGLASLGAAQYPGGAWSHNYDRFPRRPPDPQYYPVRRASYPSEWSRTWTKEFAGCYMLNDRITLDAIRTMLDAHAVYGGKATLASACRGGEFLRRAQMPDPQPAWAQQYDRHMHPVWDRKFEPPAITGLESQDVLETLLLLYRRTGEKRFLEPVPPAIAYLRRSVLADGNLARFYELETNRPSYFTRDYRLTHDRTKMPRHYTFVVASRLDAIEARYRRLAAGGPGAEPPPVAVRDLADRARRVIEAMDPRGAWVEEGTLDAHDARPASGVIRSATFAENVRTLCRYLEAVR